MRVDPIPAGFHTIAPNMIVKKVDDAVSFYRRVFGAEEILRLSLPDGKVVHCELKMGNSRLNLGETMEGCPEHTLLAQIFVANSDAVFAQAVKAGARVLSPMANMFFGSREGRILDPFGSIWTISTHKENVSVKENATTPQRNCGLTIRLKARRPKSGSTQRNPRGAEDLTRSRAFAKETPARGRRQRKGRCPRNAACGCCRNREHNRGL